MAIHTKLLLNFGCNTKEEAFTATKQAVYCGLYGRNASDYSPMNSSGQRVVNAMAQILNSARSSSATKPSSDISISSVDNKWSIDNINKNYVSQTFNITASIASSNCLLKLSGNYPEGTIITDMNNNVISSIASGQKVKVLIPIKGMTKSGNFDITVEARLNTKPVLYGSAPNSSLQDYAITGVIYEDAIRK